MSENSDVNEAMQYIKGMSITQIKDILKDRKKALKSKDLYFNDRLSNLVVIAY